jgi:hypothetical protein
MVIEPKHVGVVLMKILIFFKATLLCISWWIKDFDSIKTRGTAVRERNDYTVFNRNALGKFSNFLH